jgi:hypothetical protein
MQAAANQPVITEKAVGGQENAHHEVEINIIMPTARQSPTNEATKAALS